MPTEPINTLLLLAAGQGLFLALILATKQVNATANRILAAAMTAFSLYLLETVYYARGYYELHPQFIGVSVSLTFFIAGISYLYVQAVSRGRSGLKGRDLLHLLPFALVLLWFTPFYLQSGAEKLAYVRRLQRDGPPLDLAIVGHLQFVVGICYVILTLRLLRRYRTELKETYSSVERINLQWLWNLSLGIAGVWAVATVQYLLDLLGLWTRNGSDYTPLALALLVYTIGYLGLRQPEILHPPSPRREPTPPPLAVATTPVDAYERSGLSPDQAEAIFADLRRAMTEKRPYLRSLLTLPELADEMGTSAHNLSEVINTKGGRNFYDFINGYRVEEVKRRLRDPKSAHLTILALAEESGFNSKSVFNAFFKEATGQTPSQYRAAATAVPPA